MAIVDPVMHGGAAVPGQIEWIPIKTATDGAFALAIMRWIFEKEAFNAAYLECPTLVPPRILDISVAPMPRILLSAIPNTPTIASSCEPLISATRATTRRNRQNYGKPLIIRRLRPDSFSLMGWSMDRRGR